MAWWWSADWNLTESGYVLRIRMTWYVQWIRHTVVRAVGVCHFILWTLINADFNKCGVFVTRQFYKLLSNILAWGWYGLLKRVPTNMQVHRCVRLEYILIYSQVFFFYCCDVRAQKFATNIELTTCCVYCDVYVKIMRLMTICNMFSLLAPEFYI